MVDADPAEPLLAGFDGHPFLTGVIIDHHGSPGLADALLTADQEKTQVSVSAIRVPEAGFPFSETEADCSLIQRNFQLPGLLTAPGRAVFILQRPRGVERRYCANIPQSLEKTTFLSGKKCLSEKGSSITLANWLHHSSHGVKHDAALKASMCHNLEHSHSLPLFCRRAKSGSETWKDLHKFTQVFGA